jgi:hypothetical protein
MQMPAVPIRQQFTQMNKGLLAPSNQQQVRQPWERLGGSRFSHGVIHR